MKNKVVIGTGGASRIGKAPCVRFAKEDARAVCPCPQGVLTPILLGQDGNQRADTCLGADAVTPEAVAIAVVNAMREARFLVLPHPEVLSLLQRKTADYKRWLSRMRRLRAEAMEMEMAGAR